MERPAEALHEALLVLAVEAGVVANYCDHAEHNERLDLGDIRTAGQRLRSCALELARSAGEDPVSLYRGRLRQIEARNVLFEEGGYDGAAAVPPECTWRELQLAQVQHDRVYHPDVLGLSKLEQLRHYALHLAKLAGAVAATIVGDDDLDDLMRRRVPDMLIFGVKLATVVGERLPATAILSETGDFRRSRSHVSAIG